MDTATFSMPIGCCTCHFVSWRLSPYLWRVRCLIFGFSYLVKRGADRDSCTVENLRPVDLIEADNVNALTFLISNSFSYNGRN